MCDFDLSDALDNIDLEKSELEPRCSSKTDAQDEIIRIDEGLELVVTHDRRTMKDIANLVLAANRLKKPLTNSEQVLSEGELCSAIMDSLVEETVVQTVVNTCSEQTDKSFHRNNSQKEYTLCDENQKSIILTSRDMKLQAVTLKGGYDNLKVNFTLAEYLSSTTNNSLPVVLSIKNSKLHISCSMNNNKAELSVEECSKDSLMNISNEKMKRFLFYKNTEGHNRTRFESVNCSGWYISTSFCEENQPLEMCKKENEQRVNVFLIP